MLGVSNADLSTKEVRRKIMALKIEGKWKECDLQVLNYCNITYLHGCLEILVEFAGKSEANDDAVAINSLPLVNKTDDGAVISVTVDLRNSHRLFSYTTKESLPSTAIDATFSEKAVGAHLSSLRRFVFSLAKH